MWPFSKKQAEPQSDVISTFNERWLDIDARVTRLEVNETVFRDKVLRKVQKARGEAEELNTPGPGLLRNGRTSELLQRSGTKATTE